VLKTRMVWPPLLRTPSSAYHGTANTIHCCKFSFYNGRTNKFSTLSLVLTSSTLLDDGRKWKNWKAYCKQKKMYFTLEYRWITLHVRGTSVTQYQASELFKKTVDKWRHLYGNEEYM
jgi:hypothetical protein